MSSNPSSGNAPALPTHCVLTDAGPRTLAGLDTMEGRISAWCAWFGMEEPKLMRNRNREILLDDGIVSWLYSSGGSFNWFVAGDVRGMAVAFRKMEMQERRFEELLKRFDDTEKALLLEAIKHHLESGAPMEEALQGWTMAVEAHRAQLNSAVNERGK